jgi:DNA-binding protein YbaB
MSFDQYSGTRRATVEASTKQRLRELQEELQRLRFSARHSEHGVTVTVDGAGKVIEVDIDDRMLTGPKPFLIGPAIVQAVTEARASASTHSRERLQAMSMPPAASDTAPAPDPVPPTDTPSAPSARRRRRPATAEDEADVFGGLPASEEW